MKTEKRSTDRVTVNSIVQISHMVDHEEWHGLLAIVTEKLSWGVVARFPAPKHGVAVGDAMDLTLIRIAWEHIEPTGGAIVWDEFGGQVMDTSQPLEHHP